MQQQEELEWVGYVLRDVVNFLAKNDMMDSAKMLAVAAAHIKHDMRRQQQPVPKLSVAPHSNVVKFPGWRRPPS